MRGEPNGLAGGAAAAATRVAPTSTIALPAAAASRALSTVYNGEMIDNGTLRDRHVHPQADRPSTTTGSSTRPRLYKLQPGVELFGRVENSSTSTTRRSSATRPHRITAFAGVKLTFGGPDGDRRRGSEKAEHARILMRRSLALDWRLAARRADGLACRRAGGGAAAAHRLARPVRRPAADRAGGARAHRRGDAPGRRSGGVGHLGEGARASPSRAGPPRMCCATSPTSSSPDRSASRRP